MWPKVVVAGLIVALVTPVIMLLAAFGVVSAAACAAWDDVPFMECEFILESDNDSDRCHDDVPTDVSGNIPEEWRSIISDAAEEFDVNPNFIAAVFLTEHGNRWKPLDADWGTSEAGASGPMQFMPGTWDEYGIDGDGDGNADINDPTDAMYSTASLFSATPQKGPAIYGGTTADMPAGDIEQPWKPGTLLYSSVLYNAGPGTISKYTNPGDGLDDTPSGWGRAWEAQRYLHNVDALLSSDLSKSGVTPENGYTGHEGGRQQGNGNYLVQWRDPHGLNIDIDGSDADTAQNDDSCETSPEGDLGAVVDIAWREYERGADESPCDVVCEEYIGGQLEAWCADFVSWVYREADIPFQPTPTTNMYFYRHDWQMPAVIGMKAWFQEGAHGSEYFTPEQKDPQPGDVAIYAGHVNLVVAVDPENETLETIGGNESDAIQHSTGTFSAGTSSGLQGYGRVNAEAADEDENE